MESSPFLRVKLPKVLKKVMPTFSEMQLEALFTVINTLTPEGFRDYVLLHLYLDSAARLSEITGMNMDDVDLKARYLRVRGKGQKERMVRFGVKIQKLLWKYLNLHRPRLASAESDYVFTTKYGRLLTKNRVKAILRKYATKAGITGIRASPHVLRHTACLLWVRNHGDLFSLQKVTGHSSLAVLRGYVNLSESDVRAAHERSTLPWLWDRGKKGGRK